MMIVFFLLWLDAGQAAAVCDPSDKALCTSYLNTCTASAGNDLSAQCTCLTSFITCSNATSCLTRREYLADLNACQTLGCSNCTVGSPTPAPTKPMRGCNQTLYIDSSSDFLECIQNAGFGALAQCACYPPYIKGVVKSACQTSVMTITAGCRSLGCSTTQCSAGSAPCDVQGAATCAANVQTCVSKAGSGQVCNCYITYLHCLVGTNCLTPSQLAAQQAACAAAGCTGCTN